MKYISATEMVYPVDFVENILIQLGSSDNHTSNIPGASSKI